MRELKFGFDELGSGRGFPKVDRPRGVGNKGEWNLAPDAGGFVGGIATGFVAM